MASETPISIKAAQKSVPPVVQPQEPAFTPMTPEEKLAHARRLAAEGRQREFDLRREQIRLEQKAKGVKLPLANENSWRQALAEYPPLPLKEEPKEPEEAALTEATAARFGKTPLDVQADIEEAYQKLSGFIKTAEDFDRPGAWEFYRFARRNELNRGKFLSEFVVKFLSKRQGEGEQGKPDERDAELGDLMTAMEKEFPVEGAKVACPACREMLQLPNSLRTGDDAKSPEFHLRRAGP